MLPAPSPPSLREGSVSWRKLVFTFTTLIDDMNKRTAKDAVKGTTKASPSLYKTLFQQ